MAFPVAKLGSILLRQLSKPIANYAKERAKKHPFFRRNICMPPAQTFPVVKLAAILFKQISKPIAEYTKNRAKTHPFFRRHICMPPAQFYNWCEVKMKMWILNMGKPVEVPQLNEAMAIELGANLLGETIIFSIAALLLFLEYSRQVRKEAAKEEARKQEMEDLTSAIRELYFQTERQETQLREMRRNLYDLESKISSITHRPFGPSKGSKEGGKTSPLSGNADGDNVVVPVNNNMRYHGGALLRALDYVTFQIPNGYYR